MANKRAHYKTKAIAAQPAEQPAERKAIAYSLIRKAQPKPYLLTLVHTKRGKGHTPIETWHHSIAQAELTAFNTIGQYQYTISIADGSMEPIIGRTYNKGMQPEHVRKPNGKLHWSLGMADGTSAYVNHNDKGSLPTGDYTITHELPDGRTYTEDRKGYTIVRTKNGRTIKRKKRAISFKVNRELINITHPVATGLYNHCPICFRNKTIEYPLGVRRYHSEPFTQTIKADGYGETYAFESDVIKRAQKGSIPLGLEYSKQRASNIDRLSRKNDAKPFARSLARKIGQAIDGPFDYRYVADGDGLYCIVEDTIRLSALTAKQRYRLSRHYDRLRAYVDMAIRNRIPIRVTILTAERLLQSN